MTKAVREMKNSIDGLTTEETAAEKISDLEDVSGEIVQSTTLRDKEMKM